MMSVRASTCVEGEGESERPVDIPRVHTLRIWVVIFMPRPLPKRVLQTSYCTHFFYADVLQTVLGMGMGMNVTAQNRIYAVPQRLKLALWLASSHVDGFCLGNMSEVHVIPSMCHAMSHLMYACDELDNWSFIECSWLRVQRLLCVNVY